MQLFACRGNTILHSLSFAELPMELLTVKPLNKFGYTTVVETPDGTLKEVATFQRGTLTTADGQQYEVH